MRLALSFFLLTLSLLGGEGEKPRNIILLIGDGMGTAAVSAHTLADSSSPFFRFPVAGFSITTAFEALVTESAAGATALATGMKTRPGFVGNGPSGQRLVSLLERAKTAGYATGIVVTSSITDATPAAFYAHLNSRKNQDSAALFLLHKQADLVIGGGAQYLAPPPAGKRKDSTNLGALLQNAGYTVLLDSSSLFGSKLNLPVIALLSQGGLSPAASRGYSLASLCSLAISVLSTANKPIFLMVEGSQIDWAGHANDGPQLIAEVADFAGAITTALDFASQDSKTLIAVTADHETGGAAITKGNADGSSLQIEFITKGHTAALVPVFAFGPGAVQFSGVKQNSEIGQILQSLIRKKR